MRETRPSLMLLTSVPLMLFTLVLTSLLSSSCSSTGIVVTEPMTTISGQASFARVVPVAGVGLDYGNETLFPIRGAVVEVRSTDDSRIWSSGSTDANGQFALSAPIDHTVRIVVRAELAVDGGTVSVRNAGGNGHPTATTGPVWGVYLDVNVPSGGISNLSVVATSGWTGTGYNDSQRAAGPFAILDTVYRARALVRSVSVSDDAPPLDIFWHPSYSTSTISTSFYSPSQNALRILGQQNEDTDEYDHNVIAHEWIHAYSANLSREDSLGGRHAKGDNMDETVAFGEGFANAASGMVMQNTVYQDTLGALQGSVGSIDLTTGSPPHGTAGPWTAGPWNEFALTALIFNLYAASGDNLGFAPIHATMRGPFRSDTAFTTIYAFLHRLKQSAPLAAAAIAARATAYGIANGHDQFDGPDYPLSGGGVTRRHTTIPGDGSVVRNDLDGDPIRTDATFDANNPAPGNRLYNRLYFKSTLGAGTWTIRVTPIDATNSTLMPGGNVILWIASGGRLETDGQLNQTIFLSQPTTIAFAVGSRTANQHFVVQVGSASFAPVKPLLGDG